jgi:hypothetical protein
MSDYCMYCWREAESKVKGNPDEGMIPVCAKHNLQFAADCSKDAFAEKMGYESAEEVYEKFESEEEPKIPASKVIGAINHNTDSRGSPRNDKDPVVYSEEIRKEFQDMAQEIANGGGE